MVVVIYSWRFENISLRRCEAIDCAKLKKESAFSQRGTLNCKLIADTEDACGNYFCSRDSGESESPARFISISVRSRVSGSATRSFCPCSQSRVSSLIETHISQRVKETRCPWKITRWTVEPFGAVWSATRQRDSSTHFRLTCRRSPPIFSPSLASDTSKLTSSRRDATLSILVQEPSDSARQKLAKACQAYGLLARNHAK